MAGKLSSKILCVLYRFLHWTLTDSGSTKLFQLDLRANKSLVSLLQSSQRQRDVQNDLVPTSALTQDPETNRIWLSDHLSGNILSCATSPTLTDCQVEVSASELGNTATCEFCLMLILVSWFLSYILPLFLLLLSEGLPADNLALDEQRVYWSIDDNSSFVFYVLRSNRSSFGILTFSTTGSVILTLSLGQQPLPPAGNDKYDRYNMQCDGACYMV